MAATAILPMALLGASLLLTSCGKSKEQAGAPGPQAMPVQVEKVSLTSVPVSDQYVTTIKSRRSATISPQVDGNLIRINVRSGQQVKAGQILMEIDPAKQEAATASAKSTEQQKLALFQFNQTELERQKKLFEAGVTSRDTLDQAEQAFKNSRADYEAAKSTAVSEEQQLGYYRLRAPFTGILGDIPVHLGDYVSPGIVLTTIDENRDLEAYIFIPAANSDRIHRGLGVEILDNSGNQIEHTSVDFVSPQVDNQLQSILVKAPVHSRSLRNLQQVQARVIWSTNEEPVVPVLAVIRLGGQAFVYVVREKDGKYFARQQPIELGETVGNQYAVLKGLKDGDEVIVSGTQFLMDGMPVQPMGAKGPLPGPAQS